MARAWLRFLAAFYVLNITSLAAYFLLKHKVAWGQSKHQGYLRSPQALAHWEKRAFWMLLALAAGRYLRRTSIDAYISEMLTYLKLTAAILLASADYRLGACLVLCYALIFLLMQPPRYEGPTSVELLTPTSVANRVLHSSVQNPVSWFVMFSAPWSSHCAQAQATFAELSVDYASDKLRFAEIDVGRWPKIALQFEVCIESLPHQLPAFFMFKNGKVIKRVPAKDESWDRKGKLRDRLLRDFDLDVVLAAGLK